MEKKPKTVPNWVIMGGIGLISFYVFLMTIIGTVIVGRSVLNYWHRNDFQETHSQINRDSLIMIEKGDVFHLRIKNED